MVIYGKLINISLQNIENQANDNKKIFQLINIKRHQLDHQKSVKQKLKSHT